jgi:hypothetical protein
LGLIPNLGFGLLNGLETELEMLDIELTWIYMEMEWGIYIYF